MINLNKAILFVAFLYTTGLGYGKTINKLFLFKPYGLEHMTTEYGGDLASAVTDILVGFPVKNICICFNNLIGDKFVQHLMKQLHINEISAIFFNLSTYQIQEKYFDYMLSQTKNHFETFSIFFASHRLYEHILLEIEDRNFIRRNLIYIFYWGKSPFKRYFLRNIHYSMKVYAITNPRNDTYRLFYSQATSHREHHLDMINWWNHGKGLFHHPTLPIIKSLYKDLKGKILQVPVLHKPPWHFVNYLNNTNDSLANGSIQVVGGRDDEILKLLSKKLNFRINYFDPPERTEGTWNTESGLFNGVIGLVWRKEADLFIGDVSLTYDRSNFVEFSFITLADSGAFVTHASSRLNEALALLRPFQWKVWPAIGITFIVVGPVLYIIIALPNCWQPRFRVRSHARLFFDCTWFTVTILLKQKKPIHKLTQLEEAMGSKQYNLFIEQHSSSHVLLENGTGIYANLWKLMSRQPSGYFFVESVEEGVMKVRDATNYAVMAGRETLYFDIQRFGPSNFHLSEKLNTAYSAIAVQLGCPYIQEINRILMAIFEAGIMNKMTESEYEQLGKQKKHTSQMIENEINGEKKETRREAKAKEDSDKLTPISIKMLQGTFYLLFLGNTFSGFVLLGESLFYKYSFKVKPKKKNKSLIKRWKKDVQLKINRIRFKIRRAYQNWMHEAFVSTLEYLP